MKIDATGDVVVGDRIEFVEAVFEGSHRKPKYIGDRFIEAEVLRDSYGEAKQQHTFTLSVINSTGVQPVESGRSIRRKGRNVYRNGVMREMWEDEVRREVARDEKHSRGDSARGEREVRLRAQL